METTMIPDYARGATLEDVWAALRDVAERQKETDRMIKESGREWDRKMEKSKRDWDKKMGNLSNRFGEIAEHMVAPGINDRFNGMGYHFDEQAEGGVKIRGEGKKILAEIDLLLENDNVIMAVEVKTKPDEGDIADHIKRIEILRDHRRRKNDMRQVEGAIAGVIFSSAVKREVIKAGLYVIEQSGDTMKIEVPDGFVPRRW